MARPAGGSPRSSRQLTSDGGRGSGTEPGPDHTFSKTLPHDPNVGAESNLQTGKPRHTEVKATCRRPRRKNGAGQDAVPKALNHHHTLQSYSNDGLAAFTAGTAYPCLHVTLKSFSWLLRAGWEAADRHVCPPLSSATSLRRAHCFLTGGSPGVTRPLGAQQLASRTNAATLQRRLLTEAKRPSGSHKEQHRGSGVACSRTTGIWFDAQRTGRLQLRFLWGMKYSREEAGGAGLALVRQMESGGGRPGR